MSELILQQNNLPNNLKDLSKFVLIGREKLTAVKAEIRAIDKLEVAQEVREQKKEEAQMLGEALLDAEVRIGDLLKQIPKAKNQYATDNGVHSTKKEVISNLGFNEKQVQRFETLASNKDIVEQVKAEARENEDIPTRTQVLQLVKQKSQQEQYIEEEFKEIERKATIHKNIHSALYKILCTDLSEDDLEIWYDELDKLDRKTFVTDMYEAIEKYKKVIEFYESKNKIKVVK